MSKSDLNHVNTLMGIMTVCVIVSESIVIFRTKILTSTVRGCDSMYCPPERNVKDVIRHCEYDIPVGLNYKCFERNSSSRIAIATPNLTCEPGFFGDPQVDENNPEYVIVEKKPCPNGYYHQTPSGCYNGCKSKHFSLQSLDNYEQFNVYSEGDSISPARVYCNFKLGYYSKNGKSFLNYDRRFQYVYEDFCSNDPNHCVQGQVPLHNGTCVMKCKPGYERSIYNGFQCNMTGLVPNSTHEYDAENHAGKTAAIVIGEVAGCAVFIIVVVVIIYRKCSRDDKQSKEKIYDVSKRLLKNSQETGHLVESVVLTFNEKLLDQPRREYRIKEITWSNEHLDVVVLKISNPDTDLPRPVILATASIEHLGLHEVSFVGYGHPDINKKHLDPKCKLLNSYSKRIMSAQAKLHKEAEGIKEVLREHNRGTESVDIGFNGYDQKSKFLFDCFGEEGSSGSPALTSNNEMSIKVVGMLTHGFPKFYHELKQINSSINWPIEYRFEMGVRMKSIYELMSEENPELANELFRNC